MPSLEKAIIGGAPVEKSPDGERGGGQPGLN
jgi:hypothetical protein